MKSGTPRVSVLMPVYNGGQYLAPAIQSILDQTYGDFELIIIDDASTDNSVETINSFNDRRIRVIRNSTNQKLIAVLNKGLELAQGDYLVRMDADDISLPRRIEKQVAFFNRHPDYGLTGTWFEEFGDNIGTRVIRYSSNDTEIRIRHLYQAHVSHPTSAYRMSLVRKHALRYDPLFIHGEDYAFWIEMGRHCKMSNIPEMLVRKRDTPFSISNLYAPIQRETCTRVKQGQFAEMGILLSADELELYTQFANPGWDFDVNKMNMLADMLERVQQANTRSGYLPREVYRTYLAEKWFHLCLNNPHIGKVRKSLYRLLSFREAFRPGIKNKLLFATKTLL